ncbi:MAG: tetratricopeptide repeat protein [Acidobacteria bacterium]|nr:tetratricopeptide repeat protein [Acidobacteriota bacterium]
MKRWIDILLASVAMGSFSLIVARWVLPVMGLAGVEGELVKPLARSMPAIMTVFALTIFVLGFIMHRHGRKVEPRVSRLVDEAEQWSDEFMIGHVEAPRNVDPGIDMMPYSPFDVNDDGHMDPSAWVAEKLFETKQPIDVLPADLIEPAGVIEDAAVVSGSFPRVTANFRSRASKAFEDRPILPVESNHEVKPAMPAPKVIRPHQLPPQLPEFSGRKFEKAELLAARKRPDVRILALQGMGGVGKTTLAVMIAHTLVADYPDAQLYIDLRGAGNLPLPVADAQAMIIRSFLPAARLPEKETDLGNMYQAVLSGKRVLLLLDNAANAHQLMPLLPPEGSISIVTSRQHIDLKDAFTRQLDVLPGAEAREMLRRILPVAGDYASRLAELCGRLPLAIRLAAGAVTGTPGLPLKDYVQQLDRIQKSGRVLRPIDAVLETSYDLLGDGLQKLWRSLGVFTDTFDIAAAASLWHVNPVHAQGMMDRLLAFNLVDRNRLSGRFRLHDLMSRFADDRMTDAERSIALHRHAAHYQSVLHEADAFYEQGGEFLKRGLDLLDLEWHNIQVGQVWAAMRSENDRAACELCNSYPDAGKYVLDLRQHPRERIRWSEAALAASRILKRRKAIGRHLVALGDSYSSLSEVDQAIECYEQALQLSHSIHDRTDEADALSGLGKVHFICGEFDKAREYHNAVLEIARRMGDKRREAIGLGNLAETILAVGEANNARAIFEHQMKLARRIGDRRTESVALGGLGLSILTLGDPHKALDLLNQQLTITREIGDRRGEAGALCCLGHAGAGMNLHHQAVTCLEQALSISREIADKRHEAAALGGLGTAYFLNGDIDVGHQFFEQQLQLARETGDRRAESVAMIGMSEALNADGEADRAAELLRDALTVARQIGDILGQANALFTLALALDKLGDRNQAVSQARIALEFYEFVEHPKAGTIRRMLIEWTNGSVC